MHPFTRKILAATLVVATHWPVWAEPLAASVGKIQLGMKLSDATKVSHLSLKSVVGVEPTGSLPGAKAYTYKDEAHPPAGPEPYGVGTSVTKEDGELVSSVSGYALELNGTPAVHLGDSFESVKKALGRPAEDLGPVNGGSSQSLGYWAQVVQPYRLRTGLDPQGRNPIKCGWIKLGFAPDTKKLITILIGSEWPSNLRPPVR